MDDEQILTPEQRQDTAAYVGLAAHEAVNDEELLSQAAEKIGLEGELAVDSEGVLELERGPLLVILESVTDEDAELVERPDLLHLSLYVRPASEQQRAELIEADLLEPVEDEENHEGWTFAWWGAMCTRLPRDTPLPQQLEALHRATGEAEAALEARDPGRFFKRMSWLELESEDS